MKNINMIGLVALVILGLGCGGSSLKARGSGGTTGGGQGGHAGATGSGSAGTVAGGGTTAASRGGAGSTASAPMDGGVVLDAAPDACRMIAMCGVLPSCPTGQTRMSRPCDCPVCVPDDAGPPDAPLCPFSCPVFQCAYGSVRDPVCGCWTCIEPDAGVEKDVAPGKDSSPDVCLRLACPLVVCPAGTMSVTHECSCATCEPVDAGAEAGKPACATAKARVASLCPNLSGPTFDGLCQGSDSACVTKCLNEVSACGDISCSMCEACDCASDAFMRCRGTCQKLLSATDAG